MSERVNRIVLSRANCSSDDVLFDRVYKQLRLLIDSGYNCFVSNLDDTSKRILIEFCIADREMKHEDIPQPCWLYPYELDKLADYQLEVAMEEAKKAVSLIEDEIDNNSLSESDDKVKTVKKKKKDDFDA